tara:strand:+ start:367 stop:567 length:201 start_codon:yes stop_codon:yes gene_type:complete
MPVAVADADALARRVNLLEILAEDHESVPPPPDHAVSEWCARARAPRPGDASSPEASFLVRVLVFV